MQQSDTAEDDEIPLLLGGEEVRVVEDGFAGTLGRTALELERVGLDCVGCC